MSQPTFHQYFWRCEHHPSCIDNFFDKRATCEWCCHTQELRWHDNGMHQKPKSWARVRIGV